MPPKTPGTQSSRDRWKKDDDEEDEEKKRLRKKKEAEQEYREMLKSQERIRCLKCGKKMIDCTCK